MENISKEDSALWKMRVGVGVGGADQSHSKRWFLQALA